MAAKQKGEIIESKLESQPELLQNQSSSSATGSDQLPLQLLKSHSQQNSDLGFNKQQQQHQQQQQTSTAANQVNSQWMFPEEEVILSDTNIQNRSEDGKKARMSTSEEPQSHITFALLEPKGQQFSGNNFVPSNNLQPHQIFSSNNRTNWNQDGSSASNQNNSKNYNNSNNFNNLQSPNSNQFSSSFMMPGLQPNSGSKKSEGTGGEIPNTQRSVSPVSVRNSGRLYGSGRAEIYTTLNDLQINQDGAERRRHLLSHREEGVDFIRIKRESTLENNTQGFDDTRHGKCEQSMDSLFRRKMNEDFYQKSSSLTPKKTHDNSFLPLKSGDSFLPSRLESSGNHQTEQQQIIQQLQPQYSQSSQQLLVKQSPQFYVPHYGSGVFDDAHHHHLLNHPLHRQSYLNSPRVGKDDLSKFRASSIAEGLVSNEVIRDSRLQLSRRMTYRNPEDSIYSQKLVSSQGSQNQIQPGQTNNQEGMPPMKYMTLIFIKRFINHLKKSVQSSQFKNLKENEIKLINDLAYEDEGMLVNDQRMFPGEKIKARKKYVSQRLNKSKGFAFIYHAYLRHIVVSSQSLCIALFEIILLCSTFIQAYLIPLKICFADEDINAFDMITQVTIPIFILEIILNCITSYYKEGLEVRKQKKIIKNYLKTKFLGDVITLVSLIASYYSGKDWISLIFLGRLNRLPKLINSIDDHFQLEHRFPSSFELLKLILLIATIGHYCGSGFIYLGRYQVDNGGYSWLTYKKIESAIWDIQYLYGLYFSFITMITVGYGDITPQTSKEIIYVLFMTLLSTGTFAYSINTIGAIFREMSVRKSELKRQKYEISCYLRDRNIPKHIQIKVQKELEYFQQRQKQGEQKGDQVLQQLSLDVRNQVKKQYFGKILENYKLLKLNFSEDFIQQLSLTLKESYLSPDEVIMQQGEIQNKVLCLVSGEIIVFQESLNNSSDHIPIGKIKKGEFSDQRALFFEYNSDYGLKSSGISQLAFFTNEDFINTLKNFPQEFEKFCMLRDNILFQGKFVDLKCYCCSGFGHSTHKCDQVHFTPDARNVIAKQNSQATTIQKRVDSYQRKQIKKNALKMRRNISEKAKDKRIEIIHVICPFYQHYLGEKVQDDEIFLSKVPEIILGENGVVNVNIEEYIDEFEYEEEINDHTQTQGSGEQNDLAKLIEEDATISNIMAIAQNSHGIPQSLQLQINHTDSLHLGAQQFERDRASSALETELSIHQNNQKKKSIKQKPNSQFDALNGVLKSPQSSKSALAVQFFQPTSTQQREIPLSQPQLQKQPSSNTSLVSPLETISAAGGGGVNGLKQHFMLQGFSENIITNDSNGGSLVVRPNNNNGTNEQASSKKGKMSNYMNQFAAMTFLPSSEQNQEQQQQDMEEQQKQQQLQLQQLQLQQQQKIIQQQQQLQLLLQQQQQQQQTQGSASPRLPKLFNNLTNHSIMNQTAAFLNDTTKQQLSQQQVDNTSIVLIPNTFSPQTPHLPSVSNPIAQPGAQNSTEFINTSISNRPPQLQLVHGTSQQSIPSECVSPLRKRKRMTTLNSRKPTMKQSIIDVARMTGYMNQNSSFLNTVPNQLYANNFNVYSNNANNTTISNLTPYDGKSAYFSNSNQQMQLTTAQQQQQYNHLQTQAHFGHGGHPVNLLQNPHGINNNMNLPICDFPYSVFDFQKNYKFYFTNGNFDNIQKSYTKYQISMILARKSFKKLIKRKFIKQLQQQLQKDFTMLPSKYTQGGRTSVLVDHLTGLPSYLKQRASYKKKLLQQSNKNQTPTNLDSQDIGEPVSLSHIS